MLRPGNDGNEGVPRFPQSFRITEASLSDCLVSYPGHSLEESYASGNVQSVYSAAPAPRATDSSKICNLFVRSISFPATITVFSQTHSDTFCRKMYISNLDNLYESYRRMDFFGAMGAHQHAMKARFCNGYLMSHLT